MHKLKVFLFVLFPAICILVIALWLKPQFTKYTPVVSCPGCNIVFVSFDDLGASRVHSYGYQRTTTPSIDFFAENGFKFTNAISSSSWTLPSSMSWFTGVYPSKHKILNEYSFLASQEEVLSTPENLNNVLLTLPQILKENGYTTGGFTGGAALNGKFGFTKGFDKYFDEEDFGGFNITVPEALRWISDNKDKKLFVFLHSYDIHGQHTPENGYDRRFLDFNYEGTLTGSKEEQKKLREDALLAGQISLSDEDVRFLSDLYDEKVQRADEAFGKFIEEYKKLGLFDKTIFIITSDHGEEFYEHGRIDHGHSLYDELLKVPLVIWVPGNSKGVVIKDQVRSIDIFPTILEISEIPFSENLSGQLEGVSLVPLAKGARLKLDAYPETDYRYSVFLRAIRTADNYKYILNIENGEEQFYDLSADPLELKNMANKFPKKMRLLKDKLFDHIQIYKSQT